MAEIIERVDGGSVERPEQPSLVDPECFSKRPAERAFSNRAPLSAPDHMCSGLKGRPATNFTGPNNAAVSGTSVRGPIPRTLKSTTTEWAPGADFVRREQSRVPAHPCDRHGRSRACDFAYSNTTGGIQTSPGRRTVPVVTKVS